MSLYSDLIEAGVECSHRESDLFFPSNDLTREILKKYQNLQKISKQFISKNTGKFMYECPFAYDPYWEYLGFK